MKILFSRTDNNNDGQFSIMELFGIKQCYLKHLVFDKDYKNTTLKVHHHTTFEIHIIKKGSQVYEIDEEFITINKGEFLLISPLVKHRLAKSFSDTEKFSITFDVLSGKAAETALVDVKKYSSAETPLSVEENIKYILNEIKQKGKYHSLLIQNRVFECIIQLLRLTGIKDITKNQTTSTEDVRVTLAKQYIKDNAEKVITVTDVAIYCNLSVKQLSRIFVENEGVGVAEYIRKERAVLIEKLLTDNKYTLREISEKMNFNNEYYFNTFVKNHLGLSPGEYRKTVVDKA